MRYRSTRGSDYFGFREVLFAGLANDGGLFIPENWPNINHKDINRNVSYEDLTEIILSPFIGDEIESDQLKRIIKEAYSNNFTESGCVSFKELNTNEIIVELFNGPTLAFKDFAMQLLIPLFDHFLEKEKKRINLIVATSGDTGSAAINAVKKSKNINIFCLYPKGRISEFQRRQMSTVNQENIFLCEVEGTFDDCQKIVKDILKIQIIVCIIIYQQLIQLIGQELSFNQYITFIHLLILLKELPIKLIFLSQLVTSEIFMLVMFHIKWDYLSIN